MKLKKIRILDFCTMTKLPFAVFFFMSVYKVAFSYW